MIVYPMWETTPSPQLQAEVKPKKKKKKKIISTQQKPEQLPLFIDDYASENKVKISQLNNLTLDKLLFKLAKTMNDIDSGIESNPLMYDKYGKIPFPKIDLDTNLDKYKVLQTFDNSIYLKAYAAADNLSNSVGVAKIKVQVQKDELPPALAEIPSGMSLSNQELADLFGIPFKDLLSVSVEMPSDGSDPFSDIEPIYTVIFERTIAKNGDIF